MSEYWTLVNSLWAWILHLLGLASTLSSLRGAKWSQPPGAGCGNLIKWLFFTFRPRNFVGDGWFDQFPIFFLHLATRMTFEMSFLPIFFKQNGDFSDFIGLSSRFLKKLRLWKKISYLYIEISSGIYIFWPKLTFLLVFTSCFLPVIARSKTTPASRGRLWQSRKPILKFLLLQTPTVRGDEQCMIFWKLPNFDPKQSKMKKLKKLIWKTFPQYIEI